MMAKMTIANNTSNPICNNGAIALMMDFNTTCKPTGTYETIILDTMKQHRAQLLCIYYLYFSTYLYSKRERINVSKLNYFIKENLKKYTIKSNQISTEYKKSYLCLIEQYIYSLQ